MTPREEIALKNLLSNHNFKALFEALDLTPLTSKDEITSNAISARISTLTKDFEKANSLPVETRSVYKEPDKPRFLWTQQELKEWIKHYNPEF